MDYKDLQNKVDYLSVPNYSPTESKDISKRFKENCERIKDDFKTVRFPSKEDRQDLWEKFCEKRDEAYENRNREFEK